MQQQQLLHTCFTPLPSNPHTRLLLLSSSSSPLHHHHRTTTLFKKPYPRPPLLSSSDLHHIPPKKKTTQIHHHHKHEPPPPPPPPTTTLLQQMKSILLFSAPATALWICSPLTSLIDTAIIGRTSSTQLAALGPATALCDNTTYIFMFLSIATSNIIATSMAKLEPRSKVQRHLSTLLFLALATGSVLSILMALLTPSALSALLAGPQTHHLLPPATAYVRIRTLSLPALLLSWVAQSASLGMKDSLTPFKSLLLSALLNLAGHLLLCTWFGLGLAGAAWATVASQLLTAHLMLEGLRRKGFHGVGSLQVPTKEEVINVMKISAPVFATMAAKVGFYSGIMYTAAGMGTRVVAAHQVMIQMYSMCVVWGEPLGQAAQAFMPGLMYGGGGGGERAVVMMLKGLVGMGVATGVAVGGVGTGVLWKGGGLFSREEGVRREMGRALVQFFVALVVTPCTHGVEGTLLAGREGGFLSLVMGGCLAGGLGLLWVVKRRGMGLVGCWLALCVFQWARFFISFGRVVSSFSSSSSRRRGLMRYDGDEEEKVM